MAKKYLNAQNAFDKVWSENTEKEQSEASSKAIDDLKQLIEQSQKILDSVSPEDAERLTKKRGRPPKKEDEKIRGYRYNLNLDRDLKDYLHEAAWKKRTSITQYINDLIRADMENDAEWTKK